MAPKLFLDTWGWLTLNDKSEAKHQETVEFYTAFRSRSGIIYTTDYVLDETFTLLFKRLPVSQAKRSMETLTAALLAEGFRLEWITAERFAKAQALRLKFLDKPQISFTDLTSMVVMNELAIEQVLTGDAHFIQVGMGFQRVP
jgi:predicted nucleic acid-binding protein